MGVKLQAGQLSNKTRMVQLRIGDAYTRLAAGFRIGVGTAWRYA
jgi:hypothetical protein